MTHWDEDDLEAITSSRRRRKNKEKEPFKRRFSIGFPYLSDSKSLKSEGSNDHLWELESVESEEAPCVTFPSDE